MVRYNHTAVGLSYSRDVVPHLQIPDLSKLVVVKPDTATRAAGIEGESVPFYTLERFLACWTIQPVLPTTRRARNSVTIHWGMARMTRHAECCLAQFNAATQSLWLHLPEPEFWASDDEES